MADNQVHASRSALVALVGNALAGLAGTAAALYPINSTPAVVGFLRLSLGALTLLVLSVFTGAKIKNFLRLLVRPTVWVMAISAATYQALFFAAVERTGVATAALVTVGCIPASAGIVGWLILRERPNLVWFIATTVALSGLAVRSLGELHANNASGLVFAVVAGTGIGGYLNAAKIEVRRGANSMQLPGTAYLLGSIGLFVMVHNDVIRVEWTTRAIALALFIGVVTMGVANALQIISLKGISPGVAATMMLADPLAAAILGVVVMHEELTTQGAIGLILVLLGLALQSLSPGDSKSKPVHGRHKLS